MHPDTASVRILLLVFVKLAALVLGLLAIGKGVENWLDKRDESQHLKDFRKRVR